MEKILMKVCLDLEVSANRDPRDIASDVLEAVQAGNVVAKVTDVRYSVYSGQLISDTGVKPPRRGGVEVHQP